jgi:hypothetical protein
MPTYADNGGWVISTIAGRMEVTADNQSDKRASKVAGKTDKDQNQPASRLRTE